MQVATQKPTNETTPATAQTDAVTFPLVLSSSKLLTQPPETLAKTFSERLVIYQLSLTIIWLNFIINPN